MPPKRAVATPSVAAALATLPPVGPLCEDTREQLWSCISADRLAVKAAACLNRAWRVAAVEHGLPLQLSSGLTLDSLGPGSEFRNVCRLSARDSSLTDADLRRLGQGLLPSLTSLDASGCQHMSSIGVRALVKGLGSRLKEFSQDTTALNSSCKHMRVTEGTLKAISAAPALEQLSLTLGSAVKSGLHHLKGHPNLRKLSLYFEGFEPPALPAAMPALEELAIRVGPWTRFYWPTSVSAYQGWSTLHYPKLKLVVINDKAGDSLPSVQPLSKAGVRFLVHALKARVEVRTAARGSDIGAPYHCRLG